MNDRLLLLGTGSMMAAIAMASGALAQAPAAPPAPAIVQGPPIPGMCILSMQQAISSSTVGQFVANRLSQLAQQVKAELQPEDTAINTDGKALETARSTMDAPTFQSKAQAWQTRVNALQQKASQRQSEMEATEKKALNRIAQELDPIVRQLYQQRKCSVLVDKSSVMMANPDTDLTASAVTALNGRIQQFAFDREHLDTAAAPAR